MNLYLTMYHYMHTYIYYSIYANIQNTLFHSLNKSVFPNLSGLVLQWTGWRWRGNYEFLCDVPAHHEHNFQGKDRAMSRLSVSSILFFRPMYWNFPNIAVSFWFVFVLFFLEPLVTFFALFLHPISSAVASFSDRLTLPKLLFNRTYPYIRSSSRKDKIIL